jgi:hypothetical protein
MIACVAETIHGLWFKGALPDDSLKRYFLPVFVTFPALILLAFRRAVRRGVEQGKIASSFAAKIISGLSVVIVIAYICILDLAELAFRTR